MQTAPPTMAVRLLLHRVSDRLLELLLTREMYAVDKSEASRTKMTALLGRLPTPLAEADFVEFLGHPLDADKVGVW